MSFFLSVCLSSFQGAKQLLSTDWSYITLLNLVKLSNLLIKKGIQKQYAMLTTLAVFLALWSLKISIWSELYWWAFKERNFLQQMTFGQKHKCPWRNKWNFPSNWILIFRYFPILSLFVKLDSKQEEYIWIFIYINTTLNRRIFVTSTSSI